MIYSEVKIHLTPSKKQNEMVKGCYSVKQNKKAIEKHSEAEAKMDDDINQDHVQHSVKKVNAISEKQTKFEKKQGEKTIIAFVPDVVNSEKEGESPGNKLMVSHCNF